MYGPPLVVARFTLYAVAVLLAVHLSVTVALPAVAEGLDGGAGIAVAGSLGVELLPVPAQPASTIRHAASASPGNAINFGWCLMN